MKPKVCMHCLNELGGLCNLHKPAPPNMDDVMAIVAEDLVRSGIAARLDENTVQINL